MSTLNFTMESHPNVYIYDGSKAFTLTKWKTQIGSQLLYNSVILSYRLDDGSKVDSKDLTLKYKSNVGGTVAELLVSEGDVVKPGAELLKVQPCTHPVIMKDLCAECGTDLRHLDRDNFAKLTAATTFSMVHVVPELKVCLEQAEKLGRDDEYRLLQNRKLVLLVDLDQTLIHTTNDNVPKDLPDVHHFQLYGRSSPWYHTKLRPGTKTFLEKISKFYELHICTFGARLYAHKIAQILDPGGELFSHRILSRDECFDATSKTSNLKALFPRGDDMVCIIDDREDVWNFAPNVVHVKPYCYFHNTGDINAPPFSIPVSPPRSATTIDDGNADKQDMECSKVSKSSDGESETVCKKDNSNENSKSNECAENLSDDNRPNGGKDCETPVADFCRNNLSVVNATEGGSAENETKECSNEEATEKDTKSDLCSDLPLADDYLLYLEEILENIYKEYYKIYDKMKSEGSDSIPDLKVVVPEVRRKVLKGCNIVFSSVIPTNLHPETSRFWTLAESLGARVFLDLILDSSNNKTSHIVASKLGTAKVNMAKRHQNIHVVSLEWLFCCAERWERADERLFPLEKDITPPFLDGNRTFEGNAENPFFNPKTGKPFKRWPGSKRSYSSSLKRRNKKLDSEDKIFSERIFVEAGLAFSVQEIADMDKEVQEACDDTDGEENSNSSSNASSCESLSSADYPRGWKRPRKDNTDMDVNDDADEESSDAETIGSVDEEIAEAVRQEFGT